MRRNLLRVLAVIGASAGIYWCGPHVSGDGLRIPIPGTGIALVDLAAPEDPAVSLRQGDAAAGMPAEIPSTSELLVYPYLGETTRSSVVISWVTSQNGVNEVRYSTDESYDRSVLEVNTGIVDGKYWHSAIITGLASDSTYHYRVYQDDVNITPWPDATLSTAPEAAQGELTFLVLGDSRPVNPGSPPTEGGYEIAIEISRHEFALALHTGDIVCSGGRCTGGSSTWEQYIRAYFDLYRDVLGGIPFFPSIGNHELGGGECGYQGYKDAFFLPGNQIPGHEEEYYSFDWGSAHFVALDTNQPYGIGSLQGDWLIDDLANTDASWLFAFFHQPPYSSGGHGSDLGVRHILCPLLEENGVDVVFAGHNHQYERTHPILNEGLSTIDDGGIVYYVTGGAGAPLYPAYSDWFTAYSESSYHFLQARIVDDCRLRVDAIDSNGDLFDSHEIVRCVPTSTPAPTVAPTVSPCGISLPLIYGKS